MKDLEISPEKKTFADLLQITSNRVYSIPVYQRNYSWKTDQIETLFNDIKDEDSGYYIGNLLVTTEDDSINIIDGQQRITTLSLLLLGILEKVTKLINIKNETNNTDNMEDLYHTKIIIKKQLLVPDKNNLRLKLLDKDHEIWADLVHSIVSDDEPGKWGKYSFYKNYKYIQEKLFQDFTHKDISDFYNKLNNVVLLQISVSDLSDAYQVFASLNSKGMPLTPLDLLKNVFLSNQGDIKKWDELRAIFSYNEDINSGKMTQFVLNNYDAFENMTTSSSITKGKLVKLYTKVFKSKNYVDILIDNAKIFQQISNIEHTKYDYSLSGLSQLDSTTSYPLLMYILKNKNHLELTSLNVKEIIDILINFYVRRNIALVPKASNVRQKLFELKNVIHNDHLKGDIIVKRIQESLSEIAPDNDLIKASLKDGIYDKNKKNYKIYIN